MIAPIMVWELEAGNPRYQVPTFQMMAEMSRAKIIAKPAPEPEFSTNSTGSRATMPNATAPEDQTLRKIPATRPDHGVVGLECVGVDDGGNRIRRVVEPVDELEAECQDQGQ